MSFENLILYLETNDSGDQHVEGSPTLPNNYPAPAGGPTSQLHSDITYLDVASDPIH